MGLTLRAAKGSALTETEHDNNHKEAGYCGADMSSATNMELNNATGNKVNITGTTAISSFGSNAPTGTIRICRFTGVLTINYGASAIVLPAARNWVTVAGDILTFQHEGSGLWRCLGILPGDGRVLLTAAVFPTLYDNGNWASATQTLNFQNGARQKVTLQTDVTTLNLTAPLGPGAYQLDIYQDSTGTRDITWPASFKWPANYGTGDKTLTQTANARDRLLADYNGTDYVVALLKGIA